MFKPGKLLLQNIRLGALLVFPLVVNGSILGEELSDPTRPLNLEMEEAQRFSEDLYEELQGVAVYNYKLSSVLIRAEDRFAVINDQRMRVGDSIGSATVIAIDTNSATLNVDGESKKLELFGGTVKTPVLGEAR